MFVSQFTRRGRYKQKFVQLCSISSRIEIGIVKKLPASKTF